MPGTAPGARTSLPGMAVGKSNGTANAFRLDKNVQADLDLGHVFQPEIGDCLIFEHVLADLPGYRPRECSTIMT